MDGTVRAVIFQEGEAWVGQCVDYDIGAQAPSIDLLLGRLEAVIRAERDQSKIVNGEEFAGIPASPERFKAMWDMAFGKFTPTVRTEQTNDCIDYRIARAA
jgi:hypothetical protein